MMVYNYQALIEYAEENRGIILTSLCAGWEKEEWTEYFSTQELQSLLLLCTTTPQQLCTLLNASFAEVEKQLNNPLYREFVIPKKSGGVRFITAPSYALKKIQRRLNNLLQHYYSLVKPSFVHGFSKNYGLPAKANIAANAAMHTNKKVVLTIDLKDFFANIKAGTIREMLKGSLFQLNSQLATAITLLTTYKGALPAGAPTSAVLSNFICLPLDEALYQFCTKRNITYSRYADDLSFSANEPVQEDILLDLISVIQEQGFSIQPRKIRIAGSKSCQRVTGLVVNKKVNIERKKIRWVRAILHDIHLHGLKKATGKHFDLKEEVTILQQEKLLNKLKGQVAFWGQIRGKMDRIYLKYKQSLDLVMVEI